MRRRSLRRIPAPNTTACVISGLSLFLLGLAVVLPQYGRLDDYSQLLDVQSAGFRSFVSNSLTFGRPVTFAVNGALYRIADSVDGFWLLRLIAVSTFAAGAVTVGLLSRRGSQSYWASITFGALIFALPGTWVFITWAQGAGHGTSFLLAAAAAYAASRAYEHRGTRSLILWLLAFTLTLLAMFGYQPLGLAIPGIAIACALVSRRIDVTRIGLVMLIVAGSAFVINAAMVKALASGALSERTGFTTDWSAKATWLSGEFLPRVLWPFSLTASLLAAGIVAVAALAIFAVAGYSTIGSRSFRTWLLGVVVASAAVLAPMLPFFVIGENWASSRAVLAPAFTFWLLLIALLSRFVVDRNSGDLAREATSDRDSLRAGARIAFPTLMTVAAIAGMATAWSGLAQPSSQEWAQAKTIWSGAPTTVRSATVLRQSFVGNGIPQLSYDEYGVLTGSTITGAQSLQTLAAREGRGIPILYASVSVSEKPGTCDSGELFAFSNQETRMLINPTRPWKC